MDHAVQAIRHGDVVANELIRYAGTEAAAPAAGIEPKEMIGIEIGLGHPQLADPTIGRKHIVHSGLRRMGFRLTLGTPPRPGAMPEPPHTLIAVQQYCGKHLTRQ